MEGSKIHTMMTRITSDMVKPFNGKGDIDAWITKVELVFIPLYLEGGALAIYMEMNNADKLVASEIEAKPREAYSDSLFVAYGKFMGCQAYGRPRGFYLSASWRPFDGPPETPRTDGGSTKI